MSFLKSHFWYNKRQRNGILFLIAIILILQILYVFIDFSPNNKIDYDASELESFQAQIDSIKSIKKEKRKIKIFPFNPNYLTDYKAYKLGLTVQQIDHLFAFRKDGKFINSAEEFQKVTQINDSLLNILSPYFKFPKWVIAKNKTKITSPKKSELITVSHKDLNLVSPKELESINGIGEKLAKRIIAYRELLQGFSYNEQLYEVYYLDKSVANKVLKKYQVLKKPKLKKLDLNSATFKEILHLPYIDYKLTKKIFNYKNNNGGYSSLEDLKKIDSFPLEKFDRIALYLTAK